MNGQRRKMIENALRNFELGTKYIQDAYDLISIAYEQEADSLDNTPENLQNSVVYERLENAVDALSDTLDAIGEYIEEAVEAHAYLNNAAAL